MAASHPILVLTLAVAACARPAEQESRASARTARDSVYRRLCADADSLVAGREPCLLRDQSAPPTERLPRVP